MPHLSDDLRKIEDEKLIPLILNDQNIFGIIIERYEAKLLRYIRRISGYGKEDAEDVLQDVFIKTYQHLNDVDQNQKFSPWIYRITHNETISKHRKHKARPEGHAIATDNENILDNTASRLDIRKDIEQDEISRDISTVLQKMDVKYREVLVLKFLEGKDYQEISDILRKPMGTIATLINRAKKQFKKISEQLDIHTTL